MCTWTFGASVLIAVLLVVASSATRRFDRAHERADELALDLRRDRIDVDAGARKELAGVFRAIDTRRLDTDRVEACLGELVAIFLLLERAGDAADPELDAAADRRRHLAAHDDVGPGESAARLQHAKRLGEHAVLVAGEIDDAVGDDH